MSVVRLTFFSLFHFHMYLLLSSGDVFFFISLFVCRRFVLLFCLYVVYFVVLSD